MATGLFAPMDVIYLINKSAAGVFQMGAWRVVDSVMHPSGYYAYTNVEVPCCGPVRLDELGELYIGHNPEVLFVVRSEPE